MKWDTRWELTYALGAFLFGLVIGLPLERASSGSLAGLELPLGLLGLVLLVLGYRWRTQERPVSGGPSAPQGSQPGYVLCPHCQGQNYPAAVHCQWCGKPMKEGPPPGTLNTTGVGR